MIDTLLSTFILLSMSDNTNHILQILYRHQDTKYGDFKVNKETIELAIDYHKDNNHAKE